MKSEIKILKLLLSNKEEIFTIKKISDILGINYRIVYEKIKFLEAQSIINVTKTGNSKICNLTNNFNEIVFKAEYERRDEFCKKNKHFLVIYKNLDNLNFPFLSLLFGSYAKGRETKNSDIDLLFICEEKREREIKEILDLFPLKIHSTFINYEDFIKMLKTKEFNVVLEALKNNIILIGIEDYYRLLKNAN